MGVNGPVVGAGLVVGAADHRPHASSAIETDQRRLLDAGPGEAGGDGGRIIGRGGLGRAIQGGVDQQVGLQRANGFADAGVDPVEEILRAAGAGGGRHPSGMGEGLGALGRGDGAGVDHGVEHQGRALGRADRAG